MNWLSDKIAKLRSELTPAKPSLKVGKRPPFGNKAAACAPSLDDTPSRFVLTRISAELPPFAPVVEEFTKAADEAIAHLRHEVQRFKVNACGPDPLPAHLQCR